MHIISIDGGGYLGLPKATFIEGIEHSFGCRFAEYFDLVRGTRSGAIIALGVAADNSGRKLRPNDGASWKAVVRRPLRYSRPTETFAKG
jgi:patatin-like phospholipase/acyl hydrolase